MHNTWDTGFRRGIVQYFLSEPETEIDAEAALKDAVDAGSDGDDSRVVGAGNEDLLRSMNKKRNLLMTWQ